MNFAPPSLEKFEQLVSARRHKDAMRYLVAILAHSEVGGSWGKAPMGEERSLRFHTRLASAAGSLLAQPDLPVDRATYEKVCLLNRALAQIFAASGFRNTAYLAPLIGISGDATGAWVNDDRTRRFLAAMTLEASPPSILEILRRCTPEQALPIIFGLLAARVVLTPAASEHRRQLLELGPQIERGELNDALAGALGSAWMLCSYADSPGKHRIKLHFNRLLRRWLARRGVADSAFPGARKLQQRPTLLVVAEQLVSTHAMYRCYATFLRQLRSRFRMVMMVRAADADDEARSLFDEVIVVPDGLDLARTVVLAREARPDLIYYPSVGMRTWAIAMANLRLAPIQFFTLGHPATTHSASIDYVLMGRDILGDPDCFSEKIVLLRSPGSLYEMRRDSPPVRPDIRGRPDPLRIAIPARRMKITESFMRHCVEIERDAGGKMEFHFFPNSNGTLYHSVARQIRNWLPRAVVYPSKPYTEYIECLNRCDLALSTFPFGNACSTIDALGQGLPVVSFQGPEPHSRTDLRIHRAMGLPDWMCASDAASFRAAALRLIGDHELRVKLSQALLKENVDRKLFDEEHGRFPTDFVDTVWWLYERHDQIQRDPRKVWEPESRELVPAAGGGA